MNANMREGWWSPDRPWVHFVNSNTIPKSVALDGPRGSRIMILDGGSMQIKDDVMNEFAKSCRFPEYFGRNWDALGDCLQDMTWFEESSEYLLAIADSALVLQDSPGEFNTLVKILESTGSIWAEFGHGAGPVAFNAVFFDR